MRFLHASDRPVTNDSGPDSRRPLKQALSHPNPEDKAPELERPSPLGDFTTSPRVLLICAIAAAVGFAGALAGDFLLGLITLCTNVVYFGRFSLANMDLERSPLGLAAVAAPMVGGLIVGLMARFGSEKIRGHGIPEAIEAILLGRSRLDLKVAILKPISSAISIGTGGPFGAEGPIIMTGGAIGSLIAQLLPVSDSERKTLLVAGAAAGMTAVFGTPIAAVMLAVELLLFEWTPRSFVPVAVAAVVADLARFWLHMSSPLFPFAGGMEISFFGLACWALIGLAAGLLSCLLTQLVYACEDVFLKLPIHWMWWSIIGGLVVGLGGLVDYRALGVGYFNIAHMLHGGLTASSGLRLLAVKAGIWAVALGSGTSGGVLAPLLIIGGAMGTAMSSFLPAASPGFWALLAMSATMGGTMRSPLTATFFAVEITGDSHVLLPVLAACVTAHLCTVLLMRRSILTEKVARRGHHLVREYRVDPFVLTRVEEVMVRDVETVPGSMTLHEAVRALTDPRTLHPSFPIVDEERKVLGIIDPPTILRWRRAGVHRRTPLATLFADGEKAFLTANPSDYLDKLVERMSKANVARAVVISPADGTLLGYVNWKDILQIRSRLMKEETELAAIYPRK